ncbi:MFS transporter [Leifsonia virtsii]|uniref:MFS transporter n=1 Tax=Leifsonia virtsii TaxID=3035915 RepID=A0ABT8IWU2_9MICO|nr:MFS transporter [Leifsonia virtsii]MDN4596866.1 MFS transporter [Leifsonia virtsii]
MPFLAKSDSTKRQQLLRGPFVPFFIGRTVDLAGGAMTAIVVPLAVLGASHSITDAGIVATATLLPTLAFMLLGGVAADRLTRRSLLVTTCLVSAGMQVGMGALLLSGHYSLLWMALFGVVIGVSSAFSGPSLRGIVPELVGNADLQRANAALATTRSAVRVAGPMIGGILVASVGGGWALIVDAISSVVAAACFLLIPRGNRPSAPTAVWVSLKQGWRAFSGARWIWISSISFAIINALNVAPVQILGAAIVAPVMGAASWGALLSGRVLGTLLSSAALVRFQISRPLVTGRLMGSLIVLPLLGVGLIHEFWLLLAMFFAGGVGSGVLNVTYDSTLQAKVPTEAMSRVSSWDDLIAFAAIPAAQVAVGPIAALLGNERVAILSACGIALAVLVPLAASSIRSRDLAMAS